MSILAESAPSPRRTSRVYRRPTWWTVRILDDAHYEVTLFHQGCPLNWHVVTLAPSGALSCTCPSGREQFRRTQRGWCDHIEALIRAVLRRYRPLTLDPARLTYCPPAMAAGRSAGPSSPTGAPPSRPPGERTPRRSPSGRTGSREERRT